MSEHGNGTHGNGAPKLSAENSGPVRLPNGQLVGGNPRNRGGQPGRSGRRPFDIANEAERLLRKPKARQALLAVITDPNHPHYASVLRVLLAYRFGRPAQSLIIGGAPQSIDDVILALAARKEQQRAIAEQVNAGANPTRTFRIVDERRIGRLTPAEQRDAILEILHAHARDSGDTETLEALERLRAKLPDMIPDEHAPRWRRTFGSGPWCGRTTSARGTNCKAGNGSE